MSTLSGSESAGWEEIMGKDLAIKRLKAGTSELAEMGTVVTCNMRGFFVEGKEPAALPFEEWKNQKFKIGESDAVPGVEMALRFSRVGDVIRVRCNSRFGYGPTGRPVVLKSNGDSKQDEGSTGSESVVAIPADKDLEYELEVLAHLPDGEIDPEILATHEFDESSSPLPTELDGNNDVRSAALRSHLERLQALTELQQRKEAGNRWFSYSDFSRSARAYSKATQIADRYFNGNASANTPAQALQGVSGEGGVGEAEAALAAAEKAKEEQRRSFQAGDEEVVAIYVSCLNNMAACQLRLGDNAKVKDICIRVLEIDPANHKALLRAAKAALATHDYEECEVCLQRLADVAPVGSSAAVAAATERRRLKQAQLEYKQQMKKMSDNMSKQLFKGSAAGKPKTTDASATVERDSETNAGGNQTDADGGATSSAAHNGGSGPGPDSVVGKSGGAVPAAGSEGEVGGKAAAATPATTITATATTTTAASSADQGLLLLLLTSLAVLLVSVFLVVWTAKGK